MRGAGVEDGISNMTKAEKRYVRKALDCLIDSHGSDMDVLMICCGSQKVMECFLVPYIIAVAKKMSLKAVFVRDLELNADLRSQEAKEKVIQKINQCRPKLVVVCPPFEFVSILQRMRKSPGEKYQDSFQEMRDFLSFAMEACTIQHTYGRKFLFEQPWWTMPSRAECVEHVVKLKDVECLRLD